MHLRKTLLTGASLLALSAGLTQVAEADYCPTSGVIAAACEGPISWMGGNLTIANGVEVWSSTANLISVAGGANYSSAVIANAGTISAGSTSLPYFAIDNGGQIGTISNSGLLTGYYSPIRNLTGGTIYRIDNLALGTITGSSNVTARRIGTGIINQGLIGTITNDGLISARIGILNTGTISTIINRGTISDMIAGATVAGTPYAINNSGSIGLIVNSGLIYGDIISSTPLTLAGGSGAAGTFSGGLIAADFAMTSGTLAISDAIAGNVTNTGATFQISGPQAIGGNYSQSGGVIALHGMGILNVTGTASLSGGTIVTDGSATQNYSVGSTLSLIQAADGSDYSGVTIANGITGLTISTLTRGGTLLAAYANDYVGSNLGGISNSGTISGVATGVYVAATGNLGTLTNTGTIGGASYAVNNLGTLNTIVNRGLISGNIASASPLTIVGGTGAAGTFAGGTIAANVAITAGTLAFNDAIAGNVKNTGANLILPGTVTVSGNYVQSAGTLAMGSAGELLISGQATIDSGEVTASLTGTGNYLVGQYRTLVSAGILQMNGDTSIAGPAGFRPSTTVIGGNFLITYMNDYVGGSLANISNSGVISGVTTGLHVAAAGNLGTLTNTGTIGGAYYAIRNLGTLNTIVNSGLITGNIASASPLTLIGGTGTAGTFAGGTIAANVAMTAGTLVITDAIAGNYAQSAGVLDLGSSGELLLSGQASISGGTVIANLAANANYLAGSERTLISAAAGSSYTGVSIDTGLTGLAGTAQVGNDALLVSYANDYVGGNLASIGNSGTISGVATGVYVAATGNLGTLTNTGTIGGASYAVNNLGTLNTIVNRGLISGNIASASPLTIVGGTGAAGTFAGGTIAANVAITAGTLTIADQIVGNVSSTGANLILPGAVTVSGNYVQSAGTLVLGSAGELLISGQASIDSDDVTASLSGTGNYLAGQYRTLVSAGILQMNGGTSIAGPAGLRFSTTVIGGNLLIPYMNDYVGGSLANISNSGAISGVTTGLHVAAAGNLGTLTNTGTIGGANYAIRNLGTIGTIVNRGLITGNIASASPLTLIGGTGTAGTFAGGTISTNVVATAGTLAFNDTVAGNVNNTGATLQISGQTSIAGNYAQSAGMLDLGSTGELLVSGTATISGGTVLANLSANANYLAGQDVTLIAAAAGSNYSGAIVNLGVTGVSADIGSTSDLVVRYNNTYIGGSIANLTNATLVSSPTYGYYIAPTGTIGSLNNSGTIAGDQYAIYSVGTLQTLINSGTISGNIHTQTQLTIVGGTGTVGTLTGGTISTGGVLFAAGSLAVSDVIASDVTNAGAELHIDSVVAVSGDYTQTGGGLLVGDGGHLTVNGTASIVGGDVGLILSTQGNYLAGETTTLIAAGSGVTATGIGTTVQGPSGVSVTPQITDNALTATYLNDYIGGTLSNLGNTGTVAAEYGLFVASSGALGSLANSGTLLGSVAGLTNLGTIATIANAGVIATGSGTAVANAGTLGTLANSGTIRSDGAQIGIDNSGSIAVLSNSGTITGSHYDVRTSGRIGQLVNAGHIGSDYAVYVATGGEIATLTNSGVIEGNIAAVYNAGTIGVIANSGRIEGNIVNAAPRALVFTGGSGTTFGTLSGGRITSTAGNVVLQSGNMEVSDTFALGGGTLVNTGATLRLPQQVTVEGNYSQTGGSLVLATNNGTLSELVVSGAATISGADIVVTGAGLKMGDTITIVDAGLSGSYSGNTVRMTSGGYYGLDLSTVGGDLVATVATPVFYTVGQAAGGDAAIMGGVLANVIDNAKIAPTLDALVAQSQAKQAATLKQLAPAQVGGGGALLSRALLMASQLDAALADRTAASGWTLWGQATGGLAHRSAKTTTEAYDTTAWGMVVGADATVADGLIVGGALSFAQGWNGGTGALSGAVNRVDSYQMTGYARWTDGALYLGGRLGWGLNAYGQNRRIDALDATAHARYGGDQVSAAVESGYAIATALPGLTVTPKASVQWLALNVDGYDEKGIGGADLSISKSNFAQVESRLGAKFDWAFETAFGRLTPSLDIGWTHDFLNGKTDTHARLLTEDFRTFTARTAPDAAAIGLGATLFQSDGLSFDLHYSAQIGSGYTAHTAGLQARFAF